MQVFPHVSKMLTLTYNGCCKECRIHIIRKQLSTLNQYLNFQYHLASSVRMWQKIFQKGVNIFQYSFWKIRWDDSFKNLDLIVIYSEDGDIVKVWIQTASSSITHVLWNSICESGWFITIKVWKIYNGKIEVVCFIRVCKKDDHWCKIWGKRQEMRQMLFRLFQVFPPTNFHLAKFVLLIEKTLSIYQNVWD